MKENLSPACAVAACSYVDFRESDVMFEEKLKIELAELAENNGLEPACLFAVVEVESGGRLGAKVNGRLEPLIRFEGHYFYRLLPLGKRIQAVVRGLAAQRAGRIKNPLTQSSRWKLLHKAGEIDRPAALASCSWGVGQVMGDHWRWLDFASIDDLVATARQGILGQICLMMRFVCKSGLIEKLH